MRSFVNVLSIVTAAFVCSVVGAELATASEGTGGTVSRPADALPDLPPGQRWQAIPQLSDEFDGTKLNPAKWIPRHPNWQGREPSHFKPENVTIADGMLQLKSTPAVSDMSGVKDISKDVWVHAACVASTRPTAMPGFYQARFKASRLSMTSSFWFQGKSSEIDVVEQLGAPLKDPRRGQLMLMNTHYFAGGWKADRATPQQWKMPTGSADDYHVYGAWWKDKDTIWFYHDGVKVAEMKTGGEFLEPQYLFFDTEVFIWDGNPTLDSLKDPAKNTMYVELGALRGSWPLERLARDRQATAMPPSRRAAARRDGPPPRAARAVRRARGRCRCDGSPKAARGAQPAAARL